MMGICHLRKMQPLKKISLQKLEWSLIKRITCIYIMICMLDMLDSVFVKIGGTKVKQIVQHIISPASIAVIKLVSRGKLNYVVMLFCCSGSLACTVFLACVVICFVVP